jgi:hypothetical protein
VPSFRSEAALTSVFLKSLNQLPLILRRPSSVILRKEVPGLFGIPDVLLAFLPQSSSGVRLRAVGFEVKLKNWRRALIQAYRYAAFCELSFVVLDETAATKPLENIDFFIRSNIGLITLSPSSDLDIRFFPRPQPPYCPVTRSKLEKLITEMIVRNHRNRLRLKLQDKNSGSGK